MTVFRLTIFCLAIGFAPLLSGHAAAQDISAEVRAVIADQLAAFRNDDLVAAFDHAAPSIQGKFGNPVRFGQMVQTGYPMIWRPARWEMLDLVQTPRGPEQGVLFIDRSGKAWRAHYQMIEIDGVWRIRGVWVEALPGTSS